MDIKIVGAQSRIDSLQAKAKSDVVSADLELQAQLARFLCVLSSGLIEQAVMSALDDYAKRRSSPTVARFASGYLSKFHNAKFEDILSVTSRFDPSWREHFETNTAAEVQDAINSIVNNRNQIAHGGQVGISLVTFTEYYKHVKVFIAEFHTFVSNH